MDWRISIFQNIKEIFMDAIQLQDTYLNYQASNNVRESAVALTEGGPNIVAQIIKSGAPKPHATISNTMVAAVDKFTPPPGINMRHYLALDVDHAGRNPTTVVDALQRYFNVRPRREPIADPKDMASTDSFPTLVMDEAKAAARQYYPYRFSVNGIVQSQNQPDFYAGGGNLKIRILGPGVTSIQTPSIPAEPGIEVGPLANRGKYYPPAFAAQMAMDYIKVLNDPTQKMQTYAAAPDPNRSVNDTLSSVADTLSPLRNGLANIAQTPVAMGAPSTVNSALNTYARTPALFQQAVASGLV
jgi:hypothetical protein